MTPPLDCCGGFTRSEAMRRSIAQAGRGLPAIEPGMPIPAGTGLTRRSFALRSLGLALAVYGGRAMSPAAFEEGVAAAAAAAPDAPILVSICAAGGLDGLALLAPVSDSRYAPLRPNLAVGPDEGTPFSLDSGMHWHPAASGLATLDGEAKVAVAPAIGFTRGNQSHFTSRHFWEVGSLDHQGRVGWLGRYLDAVGDAENPLQGLSLGASLAPALAPVAVPVATVPYPERYSFASPGVGAPMDVAMLDAWGRMASHPTGDAGQQRARRAVTATSTLRKQLQPLQGLNFTSPVTYPTHSVHARFPAAMRSLAAMLGNGLPLRCVAIEAPGGYDTHARQATALPDNFQLLSDTVLAFQRDIEARGLADRVIIHIWSEFGRRPKENGTGTDHGSGGISLLIGSRVKGQMIGEFPGLSQLDVNENLRVTSDYRGLYAAMLEQWLGLDAARVLPDAGSFVRPQLLKS
jgi:uncharacterized protein (DUF1501 family)